jgi:hypothetical protein
MHGIPTIVLIFQLRSFGGMVSYLGFLSGIALFSLNCLFYICLSLFLSFAFNSRGATLGIGFMLIFGNQYLSLIHPKLLFFTTYLIGNPTSQSSLFVSVLLTNHIWTILPILSGFVLSLILFIASISLFNREEY